LASHQPQEPLPLAMASTLSSGRSIVRIQPKIPAKIHKEPTAREREIETHTETQAQGPKTMELKDLHRLSLGFWTHRPNALGMLGWRCIGRWRTDCDASVRWSVGR